MSKKAFGEKYSKLKAYTLKLLRKRSPGRAPKIEIKSVKLPKQQDHEEKGAPAPIYTDREKNPPTEKQSLSKTLNLSKKATKEIHTLANDISPQNKRIMKRNTSVPAKSPQNLFDKIKTDLQQKACRSDTPTERKSVEIGERLFKNAELMLKKKEILRIDSKVSYTFMPRISEGTNKWLNRRENRPTKIKEQVAIVSCADAVGTKHQRLGFLKSMNTDLGKIDQSSDELYLLTSSDLDGT